MRNILTLWFSFLLLFLHFIINRLWLLIVGKRHYIAFAVHWRFKCWQDSGDARPSLPIWINAEGDRRLIFVRWWANCHFWSLYSHNIGVELWVLHRLNLVVAANDGTVFVNKKRQDVSSFSWLLWHHESATSCCLCLVFGSWHVPNERNNGQIAVIACDPLVFSPICWYEV